MTRIDAGSRISGKIFACAVSAWVGAIAAVPMAHAAEVTDVLDAFDTEIQDPFDFALRLRFDSDERKAAVVREVKCLAGDQIGQQTCPKASAVVFGKEVDYTRRRNTLNIDARFGLYKDLEVHATIPVVIYDGWQHKFATGVSEKNSSVFTTPESESLFKVPFDSRTRSGLGDLSFGLKWSPYNYYRDRTQPTWVFGVAMTVPTGTPMKASNTGPGYGTSVLNLHTTMSRRALSILEPFFHIHGDIRWGSSDGLFVFQPNSSTQADKDPGSIVGTAFGLTIVPWENIVRDERVEIEGGFGMDYVFHGRDYTEVWEALASSKNPCQASKGCTNTLHWKSDPDSASKRLTSTDGIGDVEAYGKFYGWGALHYQPIKYFQVSAKLLATNETPHFISGGKYGVNLDPGKSVSIETSNSDGKNEFSPVFLPSIDTPGQRLRVQDVGNMTLVLAVTGKL
ncbi:MAG: hypothetical protein EXR79_06015 [Myxococcales bacterium]|nr:hypothetical protein [Myxococcales bacterium]